MCIRDRLKGRKVQGTICGLLFMILSIAVYTAEISGSAISFSMGLLACVAVILIVDVYKRQACIWMQKSGKQS